MDLKETDILGDVINQHWYYRSKAKAMRRIIGTHQPKRILDIGAGSGFFSKHLLLNTDALEACCVDTCYAQDYDENINLKPMYFKQSVMQTNADLVLLMDVLEHVDDDVGLLSNYVKKAPKGTQFLISVPAFQFLWSEHDVFLEHKRRYTLPEIESVARRSNLVVKRGCYFFGAVFPLAAAIRLSSRPTPCTTSAKSHLRSHHPWVNYLLAALCWIELPFMKSNRLAGLTAFCLAEKT